MDVQAAPAGLMVLLLGGTGRTGGRVLQQLLGRGVSVKAVVRSAERVPAGFAGDPGVTVEEAELLALGGDELRRLVDGCDAVVSCLGHPASVGGILGPPRDLFTLATQRVCRAARDLRPARPLKVILMSSVSVHRPRGLDARRGRFETAVVGLLRGLVPPARDNQRAADFLGEVVGTRDPYVQWVGVRPDSLKDGDVAEYALHEGLVDSLSRPSSTKMANVAHFMCELATDPRAWAAWQGKLPVIVNAGRP